MGCVDEKLRRDMQIELRQLQKRLGMTFIQVTHSREEALTMSDRVVVMNAGGSSRSDASEIFEQPASRFVGEFMGLGNIISGKVSGMSGSHVSLSTRTAACCRTLDGRGRPEIGAPGFFASTPAACAW